MNKKIAESIYTKISPTKKKKFSFLFIKIFKSGNFGFISFDLINYSLGKEVSMVSSI